MQQKGRQILHKSYLKCNSQIRKEGSLRDRVDQLPGHYVGIQDTGKRDSTYWPTGIKVARAQPTVAWAWLCCWGGARNSPTQGLNWGSGGMLPWENFNNLKV